MNPVLRIEVNMLKSSKRYNLNNLILIFYLFILLLCHTIKTAQPDKTYKALQYIN